jgi:hypothetical protein
VSSAVPVTVLTAPELRVFKGFMLRVWLKPALLVLASFVAAGAQAARVRSAPRIIGSRTCFIKYVSLKELSSELKGVLN